MDYIFTETLYNTVSIIVKIKIVTVRVVFRVGGHFGVLQSYNLNLVSEANTIILAH